MLQHLDGLLLGLKDGFGLLCFYFKFSIALSAKTETFLTIIVAW